MRLVNLLDRVSWIPKPIPPEVVFPSFGLPEERDKMKMDEEIIVEEILSLGKELREDATKAAALRKQISSSQLQSRAYKHMRLARAEWQRSLVVGKKEWRAAIRAAQKDVDDRVKDDEGKLTTQLDTRGLDQNQLTWVARTIDTLQSLQGLETSVLNTLTSRGIPISEEDLEVLDALDRSA